MAVGLPEFPFNEGPYVQQRPMAPEGITVLHVDDEPGFVDLTAAFLGQCNSEITVIEEHSGPNALDRFQTTEINCIISDYEMPEMDGIQLLEAVRTEDSAIPFILFTGKGSEEIAAEAISAGVTDYLQKGDTEVYSLLANRVSNAVALHRAEQRVLNAYETISQVFERITDAFYAFDSEWRTTVVNDRALERLPKTRDELLGNEVWEVYPEAVETVFYEKFHEAMETQEPVYFEAYYEPHDYWLDVRAYPSEDGLSVYSLETTPENGDG